MYSLHAIITRSSTIKEQRRLLIYKIKYLGMIMSLCGIMMLRWFSVVNLIVIAHM